MDVSRHKGASIAILLMLFSIFVQGDDFRFRDDTCVRSSMCTCYSGVELELECPREHPNIFLKAEMVQTGRLRAEMECNNHNRKIYTILPDLNFTELNSSPVESFKFKNCPLPEGTTIKGIIVDKLGIERLQVLTFSSKSDMQLRRDQLKGLNSLRSLRFNGVISDLPEDTFDDVSNITSLELRSSNVHLPLTIFKNLQQLDYLEIVSNNLSYLPAGIFNNQRKLSRLNIWSNNLRNLTKDSFLGASQVTELDINSNNIEILPSNVFEHLQNLKNINLNGNRFIELPVGLFSHNKNLTKLRLMYNRIDLKTLPDGFLADLPRLGEVFIRCNIQVLPENLFNGSSNLQNISLQSNKLTTLPLRIFNSQTSLMILDLSDNQLTVLPDNIFNTTHNLEVLRLSNNNLSEISAGLFHTLPKLRELYLDNNQLHKIHREAFRYTSLEILNLENNRIDFMPHPMAKDELEFNLPFQFTKNLVRLNLRNNSITHFLDNLIAICADLEVLDLSHNQISSLDLLKIAVIRPQAYTVDLTYNRIKGVYIDKFAYELQLPERIKNAQNIIDNHMNIQWRLKLNYNEIDCDCSILYFVKFLRENKLSKYFQLDTDELKCASPSKLQNQLVKLVKLEDLLCPLDNPKTTNKYCSDECECMLRGLDETVIINCSNGNLTKVPNLPDLKSSSMAWLRKFELNIENNRIEKLPNISHPGYESVIKINARNNSIEKISINELPKSLIELDISHNLIKTVDPHLLNFFNKSNTFNKLTLSKNPLSCECDSEFMLQIQWIEQKIDYNNITCIDGAFIKNKNFACPYMSQPLLIAIVILVGLLGLLVGAVFALYYKYEQEVKVWLYKYKLCLWFVTEEELDKDKKYDAFISFSHKDEQFVTEQLVPNLENGRHPFKICLHFRDWVVGEFIPNQISKSVEESRRTIVVLSPNFIDSIWGRMEFRAAHKNALSEGRARLIVVIYGELGDIEKLDPELKVYLKTNTYVKWGDPLFFDRLRYAMPHPTNYKSKRLIKSTMKSSIDDKLELIKPQAVTPPLTTPPSEQAGQNPLFSKLNNENAKHHSGLNGINGHVNGAFIINTNAKQSDV